MRAVAETNRAPLDFAEGESELVSGFNVEYARGGFALIFMAEYSRILLLSTLVGALVVKASPFTPLALLGCIGLALFWVWLRATYPRYRYDKLMHMA